MTPRAIWLLEELNEELTGKWEIEIVGMKRRTVTVHVKYTREDMVWEDTHTLRVGERITCKNDMFST